MAQFGAKRPVFAPIKTTPDGALPTYDYEKKVTIGKLVKADLTVTNACGKSRYVRVRLSGAGNG